MDRKRLWHGVICPRATAFVLPLCYLEPDTHAEIRLPFLPDGICARRAVRTHCVGSAVDASIVHLRLRRPVEMLTDRHRKNINIRFPMKHITFVYVIVTFCNFCVMPL